ncbi:hypothetical protein Taro_017089 [Colocasia esculenta]|uniref:J domain-containing protein n=1 Tax=Colocasia esculenta TaxID=4460 RepID=A0A843UQH8_COLES|nr:hypothetical protein [Colocasia esculenta]
MPALGFPPNGIPRFAPPPAGGKTCRTEADRTLHFFPPNRKLARTTVLKCRASSASSSSSFIVDYDLYDLLGVESKSDRSQIKNAYRALQKHCHPDIAGPSGHDMAIILNDAYAVLSDPNSRSAYDKERVKKAEFRGYTGKPLYSAWFGPESEQRAVFVDEVRCVGCLKCALFASNTFAVEPVYGRARVVAQWADPEQRVLNAIETCPVDCISIVERSDLAALEYLMSKQPRGRVRMTGSTGGVGGSNVFADVNKFRRRYSEMKEKAATEDFKGWETRVEARTSAMRAIRSISNWLFRQTHAASGSKPEARRNLVRLLGKPTETPSTKRLQEAAAARRAGGTAQPAGRRPLPKSGHSDEYWTPALLLPSPSNSYATEAAKSHPATSETKAPANKATGDASTDEIELGGNPMIPMVMRIPAVIAALAAAVVRFDGGQGTSSGLKEHIGGTVALEIVNSFWLQVLLAGITWYLIGAAMAGLVAVLTGRRLWR